MHAPVRALLYETRVRGEGMFIAVLEDEITSGVQYAMSENLVRKSIKAFEGIRRIRKDYIELFTADGEEIEDVVTHHSDIRQAESRGFRLDE